MDKTLTFILTNLVVMLLKKMFLGISKKLKDNVSHPALMSFPQVDDSL